jgi:hypothetical protein
MNQWSVHWEAGCEQPDRAFSDCEHCRWNLLPFLKRVSAGNELSAVAANTYSQYWGCSRCPSIQAVSRY